MRDTDYTPEYMTRLVVMRERCHGRLIDEKLSADFWRFADGIAEAAFGEPTAQQRVDSQHYVRSIVYLALAAEQLEQVRDRSVGARVQAAMRGE